MSKILEVNDENVLAATRVSSNIAIGTDLPLLNNSAEWLLPNDPAKIFEHMIAIKNNLFRFFIIISEIKSKKKK